MTAPKLIFARIDPATVYMDGSSPLIAKTREFRDSVGYVRFDVADEMLEALYEAEEYFYNLADADHDETGFVPNKEMKLLTVVRAAIAKAEGK